MIRKYLCCGLMMLLAAGCAAAPEDGAGNEPEAGVGGARCVLIDAAPEEIDDKVNVYLAMARAAKYNARVVMENMKQKIFADNPNMSPKDIIGNVLNNPAGGSELYNGIRVLDYAIMYAGAYLSDTQQDADRLILQRSAQGLAVAAVKAQGDVWIAERKIREVNRLTDRENKALQETDQLYERSGNLSEEAQSYRTALEVTLRKLKDTRENLIGDTLEYRKLLKDRRDKLELDGRKFYELDSFDKNLTSELFEKAALVSRAELKSEKVKIRGYRFSSINRYLARHYDEAAHLSVNGYQPNDQLYAEAMEKYASRAANGLIDAIVALRNNKKPELQFALQETVADELAAAIMIQIKLAFASVEAAKLDHELVSQKIALLKKEISLLKNRSLGYVKREELLEKKLRLLDLEILESRILSERAAAIIALYFYSGYAPFECQLLNQRPEYIAKVLRNGLKADRVKMLAATVKENSTLDGALPEIEKWAVGENWLEDTLENRQTEKKPVPVSVEKKAARPKSLVLRQPAGDYAPYTDPAVDKRKVMQLGSYIEPKNADLDWNILSNLYPELKKYTPKIEKSRQDGVLYHRLVVRSASGGFMKLCNKLRGDRVQCILR